MNDRCHVTLLAMVLKILGIRTKLYVAVYFYFVLCQTMVQTGWRNGVFTMAVTQHDRWLYREVDMIVTMSLGC